MTCSMVNVFCDWLDVTCSPEASFLADVRAFCDRNFWPVAYQDADRVVISVGTGKLALDTKKRFHRASASGVVLSVFRAAGVFEQYLALLGVVPHRVTRLDAALDIPVDGPEVLRALESRYPSDNVCLTRKSLRVTRLYSARQSDGQLTGTWYVGHRSNARVTARVYDKQNEVLDKTGVESPPRTRYELTFKKDLGCTLRDCLMPASLFYQYADGVLLDRPEGVSDWVPDKDSDWASVVVDTALPYELFCRRVELSPEIDRLAELAAQFGEVGRPVLIRAFKRALSNKLGISAMSLDDASGG